MVEPQIVILVVAGSSPVDHPISLYTLTASFFAETRRFIILVCSWKLSNLPSVTLFVILNC